MVQSIKSAGDGATPANVAQPAGPSQRPAPRGPAFGAGGAERCSEPATGVAVHHGSPSVAELGAVLSHLSDRAWAALRLAQRAVNSGDIELIDPLTDCIAAIGFVADETAKACGVPSLDGGVGGWLGGQRGLACDALNRLTDDPIASLAAADDALACATHLRRVLDALGARLGERAPAAEQPGARA